ncbi:hypothetical protein GCM10010869_29780 [Mesorhizobium tianshanense]|nr:hypothetical protein GCM10010869_29780 [Mesorhizobium tianshanense]
MDVPASMNWRGAFDHPIIIIDDPIPCVDKAERRPRLKEAVLLFQLCRVPHIIRIKWRYKFTLRRMNCQVSGDSNPLVLLSQIRNTRITGCKCLDDLSGPVGRPVIDHYDL